jgi:hypothetical protein
MSIRPLGTTVWHDSQVPPTTYGPIAWGLGTGQQSFTPRYLMLKIFHKWLGTRRIPGNYLKGPELAQDRFYLSAFVLAVLNVRVVTKVSIVSF